jgi:putative phage-type endonuclease
MKTIIFEGETGSPDCPEWHAWRKLGIGGSDAPVLAAEAGIVQKAKWMDSIQALWEMKTGKRDPKPANPAMMRGRKYEEAARIAYEKFTGNLVNSAFGENDTLSYVRASFDGLSFDGNLIVEIKVPGERTMDVVREGNIPEYYLPQLAHQAVVAWGEPGLSWQGNICHFVAYVPETGELVRRDASVQRLADIAHGLLEAESRFWEFVRQDVLPCGDVWQGASAIWLSAHAALEVAKSNEERAKQRLIELLGESEKRDGAGVVVYRSSRLGAVDYEPLLREYGIPPERLDGLRKKSSQSITVKSLARA